jgi:hypothetical protein
MLLSYSFVSRAVREKWKLDDRETIVAAGLGAGGVSLVGGVQTPIGVVISLQ